MTEAQLACLAVAASPVIVGAIWALGDLVGHVAAQKTPPSPARVARLSVAFVPTVALYLAAGLLDRAAAQADRFAFRLRDWMDA